MIFRLCPICGESKIWLSWPHVLVAIAILEFLILCPTILVHPWQIKSLGTWICRGSWGRTDSWSQGLLLAPLDLFWVNGPFSYESYIRTSIESWCCSPFWISNYVIVSGVGCSLRRVVDSSDFVSSCASRPFALQYPVHLELTRQGQRVIIFFWRGMWLSVVIKWTYRSRSPCCRREWFLCSAMHDFSLVSVCLHICFIVLKSKYLPWWKDFLHSCYHVFPVIINSAIFRWRWCTLA